MSRRAKSRQSNSDVSQVDLLGRYKEKILSLGKDPKSRAFIEPAFTRWYFNAKKQDLLPVENIVRTQDLQFGNEFKGCHFNLELVERMSEKAYNELIRPRIGTFVQDLQRYQNLDHLINPQQLQHLREIYRGDPSEFEGNKNKLINVYRFVGINSIHYSIPPCFNSFELFGSPLNTSSGYCSPFEFEKVFGSSGSFFDYDFSAPRGSLYTCNPPFDEEIIERTSVTLESRLREVKGITVLVTLPVWDSKTQQELGLKNYGLSFKGFELLTASEFFVDRDVLDSRKFKYFDYYSLKLVPVSHTHLILLSNTERPSLTIPEAKEKWLRFSGS